MKNLIIEFSALFLILGIQYFFSTAFVFLFDSTWDQYGAIAVLVIPTYFFIFVIGYAGVHKLRFKYDPGNILTAIIAGGSLILGIPLLYITFLITTSNYYASLFLGQHILFALTVAVEMFFFYHSRKNPHFGKNFLMKGKAGTIINYLAFFSGAVMLLFIFFWQATSLTKYLLKDGILSQKTIQFLAFIFILISIILYSLKIVETIRKKQAR